jgi:hypothetical protein
MDLSQIKKKIRFLESQRQKKIDYLLAPKDMVAGSIYTVYKKCGNKNCRCARGKLHGPFHYLSRKVGGKTKLTFVRRADEDTVEDKAYNYRKYTKALADLGKINARIYGYLKKIKEIKTVDYGNRKV